MNTNFLQYKQLISEETRIGKSNLRLRNVYKISQYKYADGKSRNLADGNAAYVFVIGRVGDVIHALKLNEIKPVEFFTFLSKLKNPRMRVTESNFLHLDETLRNFGNIKTDDGQGIYNILKGTKIYRGNYRTYKLNSLTYLSEVFFEGDVLARYFEPGLSKQEKKQVIKEEELDDDID